MHTRAFAMAAVMIGVLGCGGGSTAPAASGGGGGGGGGGGVLPANTVQALTTSQFNPTSLSVPITTSVSFTFFGQTHNVTFDALAGAPANIGNSSNATVARVFGTVGTFTFQCTLHPGMTGQVVVTP